MYHGAAVVARNACTTPALCSLGSSPTALTFWPLHAGSRRYDRNRYGVLGTLDTSDETRHTRGGDGRGDAASSPAVYHR